MYIKQISKMLMIVSLILKGMTIMIDRVELATWDFLIVVQGPFCDPSMLICWHSSVDIDEISICDVICENPSHVANGEAVK